MIEHSGETTRGDASTALAPPPEAVLARNLLVGVDGAVPGTREERLILEDRVLGFLLQPRNMLDAERTRDLCASLQKLASRVDYELTIAVDPTGLEVSGLRDALTAFPEATELGREGDAEAIGQMAGERARELLAVGVNLSLGPVCDLMLPGVENPMLRGITFGRDPELVGEIVSAYVRGARLQGLQCCAKWFPGQGGVAHDPRLRLPRDERVFTQVLKRDLLPFAAAIEAKVDWVMLSHVSFPQVDPLPASLSPVWARSVLRDYLGFRGRVLSDDVEMAALEGYGDVPKRARRALDAGADAALVVGAYGAGWA
jgi:beta-N-acetylhexosaminidase